MRVKFFLYFFFLIFIFNTKIENSETSETGNATINIPLSEISRISKIATRYVSGANIPEILVKPKRRAKTSVMNNYKAAILRRQMWSEVLKVANQTIFGYNLTISNYYSNNPPPVQAFMKSESPIEVYSQCLNAFNYFYVYPKLIKCNPTPSKELLAIIFRYICMRSAENMFNKKWIGSIFILKEIIEKSLYSVKKSKFPKHVLTKLINEYKSNPYNVLVPLNNRLGKHIVMDIDGINIWRYLVNRSRLLYSINSPTRAPRRGEWAFILISGNPTPKEFFYLRKIRFINTDSVQLITAILFTMILLKVKNPSQFKSYEVIIEDSNKIPKKTVNSNLLLSFSSRIATDYSYANNDWNYQIDTLLDIDLEEINKNKKPTFKWNSKPLISLVFEPDITLPDQLISNCVRYCEDLVSREIVSIFDKEDDKSNTQKKLELICKKLQDRILPFTEIFVDPDPKTPKSILKSSINVNNSKKKIKFNPKVEVYTYNTNEQANRRYFLGNFPIQTSIKTLLLRKDSTAKPEIPTKIDSKKRLDSLDEDEELKFEEIDEKVRLDNEDMFTKTPYPRENDENFNSVENHYANIQEYELNLRQGPYFHSNQTKDEYQLSDL